MSETDAESQACLARCLKASIREPDFVNDLIGATLSSGMTVNDFAEWSETDISSKLFLSNQEAADLSRVCRGIAQGDASALVDLEKAQAGKATSDAQHASDGIIPEMERNGRAPSAVDADGKSDEDRKTSEQAVMDGKNSSQRLHPGKSNIPMNKNDTHESGKLWKSTELFHFPSSRGSQSPRVRLSAKAAESLQDDKVPSFMRSTAAFRNSISSLQGQTFQEEPVRRSASAVHDPEQRMSSLNRLLRPTAAHINRLADCKKERRTEREHSQRAAMMRRTTAFSQMLTNLKGHRLTRPVPFRLNESCRQPLLLSTDELRMRDAQNSKIKRRDVPDFIYKSPRLEGFGRTRSERKDPKVIFEPFEFSTEQALRNTERWSARRHQELLDELRASHAQFHAHPVNKKVFEPPETTKPPPPPPTKATDMKLNSAERVKYYKEILEPIRRSKMAPEDREKLELLERRAADEQRHIEEEKAAKLAERQRMEQLMAMPLEEYRKLLQFKANPPPKVRKPFQVDPTKSRPTTQTHEFNLSAYYRPASGAEQSNARASVDYFPHDKMRTSCVLSECREMRNLRASAGDHRASSNGINLNAA